MPPFAITVIVVLPPKKEMVPALIVKLIKDGCDTLMVVVAVVPAASVTV